MLLPSGDLEVRVWVGFGLTGEDGFILKRSANEWSAIHLGRRSEQPSFSKSQENLAAPKSGWDRAWQKLVDAGILTLPDAEALHCNPEVMDGTNYIVEINHDKTYRSYRYLTPWDEKPQPGVYTPCKEAKQMLAIGKIIADEYGLKRFDLGG